MARKYKVLEQSEANLTKQQQEAKYNAEILASDGYKLLQNHPLIVSLVWLKRSGNELYQTLKTCL
jgi:hypothetical protein